MPESCFAITPTLLFTGDEMLQNHTVIIEDQHIQAILPSQDVSPDCRRANETPYLLAPGFIDTQVNGGGGVLFNDAPNIDSAQTIATSHRQFGTTGLLPTLITDAHDKLVHAVESLQYAIDHAEPGILGIHLEGPFISNAKRGVHHPDFIRHLDVQMAQTLPKLDNAPTIVTLAPEVVATDAIEVLTSRGFIVNIGHTAADYATTKQALMQGARGFTHLFNAMSGLESRSPGVVGAALEDADSWCGCIVDGYHIDFATLRVALAAKANGKMLLVTDAMPSVGYENKQFALYGTQIQVENGRCTTSDGTLAGSDLDMATAVRNTIRQLHCSVEESLRMASRYPAEYLGLDHRYGSIAPRYVADLVGLDNDYRVEHVWMHGRLA